MAVKVIFLTTTGAGTWTVPSDWTDTNTIEVLGGGAGGRTAAAGGGGGGGGQYRKLTNLTGFTPGSTSVSYSVGAAGSAGNPGGNTWFNGSTFAGASVSAQGGQTTTSATGGAGGSTGTGGSGSNGGTGGAGSASVLTGGGGGGAAGPGGTGGTGGNGDATAAGADFGGSGGGGAGLTGAGGNGGAGTTAAGAVGAAGAGGGGAGGAGGGGAGATPAVGAGVWTSTHAADGTTTSVATAAPGGGGGGAGSATTATVGNGANYGGGGGGAGVTTGGTSAGGQGLIVITYTTPRVVKRFRLNFNDLTKLWIDSGQVTQVTAVGDQIGYVADVYGTGIDFYQTSSSFRPILRYDSGKSRYYAEFDGVDDRLESVDSTLSINLDEFLQIAAAQQNGDGTGNASRVFSAKGSNHDWDSADGTGIGFNATNDSYAVYSNNGAIAVDSGVISSPTPWGVYEIYLTPSVCTLLINGTSAGTPDTTVSSSRDSLGKVAIGTALVAPSGGTYSEFLNGRIYSLEFDGTQSLSSTARDSIRYFHTNGINPSTSPVGDIVQRNSAVARASYW